MIMASRTPFKIQPVLFCPWWEESQAEMGSTRKVQQQPVRGWLLLHPSFLGRLWYVHLAQVEE